MNRETSNTWSLSARYIFPVDGPPLEKGIVVIEGARIKAVEPKGTRTPDLKLEHYAAIPGLVNAHTHLDLSGLGGKAAKPGQFTDWLSEVIHHRRSQSLQDTQEAIRDGLRKCLRTGTTLIGDISGGGLSWDSLCHSPLRSVVFYELIGLPDDRARQAWISAKEWLAGHPATAFCRPGLSPHAPYSVRASLFELAAHSHLPISIHVAETVEEPELLKSHSGPFRRFLEDLSVCDVDGLAKSIDDVLSTNQSVKNLLVVHGNYLDSNVKLPAGATVIYCPRTHAYFGHSGHPFREMLTQGIRVALGTDSLASNPDLNVLAEARYLHERFPELPGATLLRMATLSGAEALGWQDEVGSLTPGKSADLAFVPLSNADFSDPYQPLFEGTAPVRAVLFRGRWVYGSLETLA